MLTDQQIERYSRHIILPNVGSRGQQRLLSASAAIVGDGELSSTAAQYLAAAGVGHLAVSERVFAAVKDVNPDCRVEVPPSSEAVRSHDVVISAGAPLDTCLALNATCVALGESLVWGEVGGCVGQLTVFAGHRPDAPCYRCSRPQPDGESAVPAVLAGAAAAFVGTMQATEAIKVILGIGTLLTGRMLVYDLRATVVHETSLLKDPRCVCCSPGRATCEPAVVG